MKHFLAFFLLVSGFLVSNCASAHAGLATSNIPLGDQRYRVLGTVEKKTRFYAIDFGIVAFPTQKPPLDELLQQALQEKEADALVNIRYWNDRAIVLFVTIHRIGFSAEAVRFEDPNALPPVGPARKK